VFSAAPTRPFHRTPAERAAELRLRAQAVDPAQREYLFWLAAEWDRAAMRDKDQAARLPIARRHRTSLRRSDHDRV
jgi:P pilus assembly chaperone PapD